MRSDKNVRSIRDNYADRSRTFGSEDPSDPAHSFRVLTIRQCYSLL